MHQGFVVGFQTQEGTLGVIVQKELLVGGQGRNDIFVLAVRRVAGHATAQRHVGMFHFKDLNFLKARILIDDNTLVVITLPSQKVFFQVQVFGLVDRSGGRRRGGSFLDLFARRQGRILANIFLHNFVIVSVPSLLVQPSHGGFQTICNIAIVAIIIVTRRRGNRKQLFQHGHERQQTGRTAREQIQRDNTGRRPGMKRHVRFQQYPGATHAHGSLQIVTMVR
mmetsp:Transcript_14140/g.30834  ORF Transcript_14140/g.30834 Transcript_14140/m.30834 type:complete len:223 (+) Transcript_14140:1085-1753(+)